MSNKNKLSGQASAEQIAEWKAKHGKIFAYEVDDKVCYLRTVDRNSYALGASKVTTSPAKFNEVIIENIWLGGDEALKKEDSYYFGLSEFVDELMNKKKGSLTEL